MPDTFTAILTQPNGDRVEVDLSPEQALDLGAGEAVAYFPTDERLLVTEDGELIERESAR